MEDPVHYIQIYLYENLVEECFQKIWIFEVLIRNSSLKFVQLIWYSYEKNSFHVHIWTSEMALFIEITKFLLGRQECKNLEFCQRRMWITLKVQSLPYTKK